MICACDKFMQESPRVQDSVYNYHNDIPGRAGFPNLTPVQWQGAMTQLVSHMRREIATVAKTPNDGDFTQGLLAIDDSVGRSIGDFAMQMVGDSAAGNFNRIMLADIKYRMSQPDHVYSCFAGTVGATWTSSRDSPPHGSQRIVYSSQSFEQPLRDMGIVARATLWASARCFGAAGLDLVARLVDAGVLREMTGRAAWRAFAIA